MTPSEQRAEVTEIPLTNSPLMATIDSEDAARVSEFKWMSHNNGKTIYRTVHPQVKLSNFIMQKHKIIFDHKDRNPRNNTKGNLREASYQQNNFNSTKQRRGTSSRFKGVKREKRTSKWVGQIQCDGIKHHLGTFLTEEAAALAYNKKANELFGDFANLNIL